MTQDEVEAERLRILVITNSQRNEAIDAGGYEFTLRDVERNCEVYRYSDNYGELECSRSNLNYVERSCEVYFAGIDDKEGEFECSRSSLNRVESYCSVSMYSDMYGEVSC